MSAVILNLKYCVCYKIADCKWHRLLWVAQKTLGRRCPISRNMYSKLLIHSKTVCFGEFVGRDETTASLTIWLAWKEQKRLTLEVNESKLRPHCQLLWNDYRQFVCVQAYLVIHRTAFLNTDSGHFDIARLEPRFLLSVSDRPSWSHIRFRAYLSKNSSILIHLG